MPVRVMVTGPLDQQVLEILGHPQPSAGSAGSAARRGAPAQASQAPAVVLADERPESATKGHGQAGRAGRVTVRAFQVDDEGWADDPGAATEITCAPDEAFLTALRWAEQQCRARQPEVQLAESSGGDVILVGAGVVNLVTAYYLAREGHRIRVLDARPDPRRAEHWSAYGCSRAGGDARMFTLTEADDYHAKAAKDQGAANGVFRRKLDDRGWNVKAAPFTPAEERWVADFEAVPCWLARLYNEDIFSFNKESRPLWDAMRRQSPELFRDVGYAPGILRLYTDPGQFASSVRRHEHIGALRRVLEPEELRHRHPGLRACRAAVVGGLEVPGFTVGVHRFIDKLIAWLERAGVSFSWDTPVDAIERTGAGQVQGLRVGADLIRARNYVLSPGCYGRDLLAGTRSAGQVHGVLGVWMLLPNTAPTFRHSLKLSQRGHIAEDANVTLGADRSGRPMLTMGSGYGYVGEAIAGTNTPEVEQLFELVESTCREFFPRGYALAGGRGCLRESYRVCVRPWTASNLGIFETIPAAAGGVAVVTGGHNTGGFAQSPSVAQAVLAALAGLSHPMHDLYRPDRLDQFLRPASCRQETTAWRMPQAARVPSEMSNVL